MRLVLDAGIGGSYALLFLGRNASALGPAGLGGGGIAAGEVYVDWEKL